MMDEVDTLSVISNMMLDDLPCYVLSGSGIDWFFSPDTQQMVRVQRGIEITPLDDIVDASGKMLVSSLNHVFLIPQKEILEVGYN
tara:strand:+ start:1099 stop:1353 length:255 start_codon:yes stop_codon:yes gene_type:complete